MMCHQGMGGKSEVLYIYIRGMLTKRGTFGICQHSFLLVDFLVIRLLKYLCSKYI
jgi:hypothetical protein